MSRKRKKKTPHKSELAGQREISRPADGSLRVFGSPWFAILVLVAAVLAVYANSLRCPFVFDDHFDIIDNTSIRHLWPLWDVFLFRSASAVGLQSRPVVNLSFALDYAVGGLNTWPYHVTNLAIHVLAGLALFGVVRRTLMLPSLRDRFGRVSTALALAVALLWALHPLQTESVIYITQRYESMMGLFYLVAVYGFIRSSDSTHPYCWNAMTVAATLLALGSKEVAVSLPIIILLVDRVLLSGSFAESWRRRLGDVRCVAGRVGRFALLQLRTGPRPWAGYAIPLTWFEYACSEAGVILHYLRLAFWPHPLVLDYGWPPARTVGQILPGTLVVAGLLAATGYAFWRRLALGLLGAWFFLILAPTSSVLPLADLASEHRMYLPLAATVVAVVLGVYGLAEALALSAQGWTTVLACLLGSVSLALGILTWQRNNAYRDDVFLWQEVVARRPNNPRAHYNLALAMEGRGRVNEAIVHYRKAVEIKPDAADAQYNLGLALASRGQVNEAIVHYLKALESKPNNVQTHTNLGVALAGRGQVDEAIAHFHKALEIQPECAEAYTNLGNASAGRGQVNEAIAYYRKALEIEPNYVLADINLGLALAGRRRLDEALQHYQTALGVASARNDRALAEAIRDRIRLLHQPVVPAANAAVTTAAVRCFAGKARPA